MLTSECSLDLFSQHLDAYDVAYVLAEHGCDLQGWTDSDDGTCSETLLHRAINRNLVDAAVFLIEKFALILISFNCAVLFFYFGFSFLGFSFTQLLHFGNCSTLF